jgi:hypothetical protein
MALSAGRNVRIKIGRLGPFRQLGPGAFCQHADDRADDLEMAQLLRRNVEQHILAAGIAFGKSLGEIPHSRRQLALRSAELFQHQARQLGIRLADADGIHQLLVVHEHLLASSAAG